MGMFDTVFISGLYCYYCGGLANEDWQTKDGDNDMSSFDSLDDFFTKHQDAYVAGFSGDCSQCGKWLRITLPNETEASKAYREVERLKWEGKYREKATAAHPNHGVVGSTYYSIFFDNAWCDRCRELGVDKGEPSAEMDSVYLEGQWERARREHADGPKTPEESREHLHDLFERLEEDE